MGEGIVKQATLRQLQSLLQAQSNLRKAAEKRAREAMAALERVAEGLAPAEIDRLRRESTAGISPLAPRQLADLVLNVVRRRISRLEAVVGVDPEELEALRAEVVELQRQAQRRPAAPVPPARPAGPTQPEKPAKPRPREPTKKPKRAKPAPATPQPAAVPVPAPGAPHGRPPWMPLPSPPPSTPASPPDTWPGWAQAWRAESGSYERDVDVVIILGDTGIARREDVDELLAEWWGISSGSGSIGRAIIRVREAGLVEAIPSRRGRGRYPRHLLRLTERGQDIFRLLRGEAPAPAQTTELLKRHKSPEHAALNLDAANRLWEAGYGVDLFPDPVALDTATYYPDLTINTPEGRTLYVECERNTRKNPQERERKWALYYAASGGHFLVVTSSEEAGQAIQREIKAWAGERPLTLWMASVEGQEAGLEWVDVRQGVGPVSNIGD
jgi:hypothetical protein